MTKASRDTAKRIIAAIVQLNGGTLEGKTRLYKAFYAAHLFHWCTADGVLTDHPIVRMPNGPGIAGDKSILRDLQAEKVLDLRTQKKGPYSETVFVSKRDVPVTETEENSIRRALDWVDGKDATELSDITHEYSKAWQESENGEVLEIYIDVLGELESNSLTEHIEESEELLNEFWPQTR